MTWNEFFMRQVYLYASKSKDASTKIGAVLVRNNTVISGGYNGICRDVREDFSERHVRPLKYSFYEHAERNSFYNAARMGICTEGSILYTNGLPCLDCARGVIQSGIYRVVIHKQWNDIWLALTKTNPKWMGYDSYTKEMFQEARIIWEEFDMRLGIETRISELTCSV